MSPQTVPSIVLCVLKCYLNAVRLDSCKLLVLLNIFVRFIHVYMSSSGSLKFHSFFHGCVVFPGRKLPQYIYSFSSLGNFQLLLLKQDTLAFSWVILAPYNCPFPSHYGHYGTLKSTESSMVSSWSSHHFIGRDKASEVCSGLPRKGAEPVEPSFHHI